MMKVMLGIVPTRVALLAGLTLPSPAVLPAQGSRPPAAELARLVDSLAQEVVRAGLTPGLGVALVMDGRTILAKGYGHADLTAGIAADQRTLWYLASTSKSFTGFAVSLLAEEGALDFQAPITRTLPTARWHPEVRPGDLTLARFLSHTQHLGGGGVVLSAAFTGAVPEADWPALLATEQPTGSTDLVYSNLGYNVAAMVIDHLRPEGWRRFMDARLFGPAGMRETYARVSGIDPARIARPHELDGAGRFTTAGFAKTDATMNSAGGHLATVGDLARWVAVQMDSGMLEGRRVFPAAAVARSQALLASHTRAQSRRFAGFDREGWGAGWDIGGYRGERMVSRFGSYHSTRSHLSFLPARRIGVVALTTGRPGSGATDLLASFAYDLEAGRPDAREAAASRFTSLRDGLERARAAAVAADSARRGRAALRPARPLDDYAGTYAADGYGRPRFRVEGGRLRYEWGVLYGDAELSDPATHTFLVPFAGNEIRVRFSVADSGPARAIELQGITFQRVPEGR